MAKKMDGKVWRDRKRIVFFGLPLSFTVYSFSEDRIFINKGFFKTTEDEVRLYRVMDISLVRTLGQRIFGLGTIKICSADKTLGDFEFKNIKKSKETKELLSELVERQRTEKHVINRENMFDSEHDGFFAGYDDHDGNN